ncbi:MAG: hypothetical protein HQ463_05185 [Bacteroidetes bacterium]|nr:hypothetical protein [Bacteroidota bacterium]
MHNLLPAIPELKTEILFEIEKQMPNATPAFIYRANKFILEAEKVK